MCDFQAVLLWFPDGIFSMEEAFHGWMRTTNQPQSQQPHLQIFTLWKVLQPVAYIWQQQRVHQNIHHFGEREKLTPIIFLKRTLRFLLTTKSAFSTMQNPHRPQDEHPLADGLTNIGWTNILVFRDSPSFWCPVSGNVPILHHIQNTTQTHCKKHYQQSPLVSIANV